MDGARDRLLRFCDYMLDVVEQTKELSVNGMVNCGVGIRFADHATTGPPMVCIDSILDGSPASRCSRIKVGDLLVRVDNTSIQGKSMREVLEMVEGPPGTVVRLGFLAADSDYIEVKLERTPHFEMNGMTKHTSNDDRQLYGVGIIFQETYIEGMPRIHVNGWKEDSPAQQSGRIKVGDVLVMIDGQEIYGKSLSYIKERLPGPFGSEISLVFIDSDSTYAAVRLRRTIPISEIRSSKPLFGIGVGFAEDHSLEVPRVFITQLVPNTPAQMSGVLNEGDMLVVIDDKEVYGKGLDYLSNLIPGPSGTKLTLGVISPKDSSYKEVTLERTIPINGPRRMPIVETNFNGAHSAPVSPAALARPIESALFDKQAFNGKATFEPTNAANFPRAEERHSVPAIAAATDPTQDKFESMAANLPAMLAMRKASSSKPQSPSSAVGAARVGGVSRQEVNPLAALSMPRPAVQGPPSGYAFFRGNGR